MKTVIVLAFVFVAVSARAVVEEIRVKGDGIWNNENLGKLPRLSNYTSISTS